MWDEDYGFALRVWLGWLSSNSIRISSGCFHPVFREQRYEPPSTRKPRSSSTTTNTRQKERKPKCGSGIEQPPRAIVRTRSRKRERHAVLKHHIWRPVQARQRLPINSRAHRRLLQAQHHMYEHASKRCQRNTTGGAAAPPIFTGKQRSRSRKWSMRQERRENSR
jgi:hypothetical protein